MAMKTWQEEKEDIIDRDGTIGYMLVVGLSGFIIFLFFAVIWLSLKGVNVFG
jgi:uncharacterized membrane protein YdjX (TVP38/TMEM64 family)